MSYVDRSPFWRLAPLLLAATTLIPAPDAYCAERIVLLEKFSASWCPHCMTAAQAIDDLVTDYPNQFIPLEIFTSTSGRYTRRGDMVNSC